jgi:D-glycero-alpha-D-manno-heptose-7-phosphate kinase
MFLVPPQRRITLIRALTEAGVHASAVHFTTEGAESWSAVDDAD